MLNKRLSSLKYTIHPKTQSVSSFHDHSLSTIQYRAQNSGDGRGSVCSRVPRPHKASRQRVGVAGNFRALESTARASSVDDASGTLALPTASHYGAVGPLRQRDRRALHIAHGHESSGTKRQRYNTQYSLNMQLYSVSDSHVSFVLYVTQ